MKIFVVGCHIDYGYEGNSNVGLVTTDESKVKAFVGNNYYDTAEESSNCTKWYSIDTWENEVEGEHTKIEFILTDKDQALKDTHDAQMLEQLRNHREQEEEELPW